MNREAIIHNMYVSQDLFKENNSVDEVVWSRSKVLNSINKIIDDFESRTCDICEYYKEDTMTCSKKGISVDSPRYIDFVGCNKWEAKDA